MKVITKQGNRFNRRVLEIFLVVVVLLVTLADAKKTEAMEKIKPLSVAVIKSSAGLVKAGETVHKDKAGEWVPDKNVVILAVSIPEQIDVDLYTDIEVSTSTVMYQTTGHIFRVKYSGPGLYDYGATSGNTYLGSNITTTNITFPNGYGIFVKAGSPVYVHLDVRNGSLIDITVEQDCYIYYTKLK